MDCLLSVTIDIPIPAKMDILKDNEIWIADSGATNHCSKSDKGATNVRKAESLAMGFSGPAMVAESEMDLPSVICDRFGQEQLSVILTYGSCRKGNNFNLFSVGRCLVDD